MRHQACTTIVIYLHSKLLKQEDHKQQDFDVTMLRHLGHPVQTLPGCRRQKLRVVYEKFSNNYITPSFGATTTDERQLPMNKLCTQSLA